MDQAISCDDVELPAGRLCDKLREEQDRTFPQGIEKNSQIDFA
jgi:predicted homoserine dehydrogenase-like protein